MGRPSCYNNGMGGGGGGRTNIRVYKYAGKMLPHRAYTNMCEPKVLAAGEIVNTKRGSQR